MFSAAIALLGVASAPSACRAEAEPANAAAAVPGVLADVPPPSNAPGPSGSITTRPTLREVLARHAAALGGLERLRGFRNLRAEGAIEAGGLQGTFRGYVQAPGRTRSELDLTVVRQVQVTDGDSAWLADQNGQIKDLTGADLAGQITEAALESYRYLLAPPDEVAIGFSSDSSDSAQYVTLRVQPRNGEPVELALDPSTWLVRKRIQQSAAGRVDIYLDDYRDVGGIPMPFHGRQVLAGDQAHAIDTRTTHAELLESLPDSLWRKPGEGARDWSLPAGHSSLTVPVRVLEHHIFIPVRVNGSRPLNFLIDSGAGASVIESGAAEALGLKSQGRLGAQGVGGSAEYGFTIVDSLDVGGALLRGQHLITLKLPDFQGAIGLPVDGILGYDFLSRFVTTLDYAGQTITLTDPESWRAPRGASAVPLDLEQNVPVIPARYDGHQGRFILDTGNNGTLLLHGPFVRRYKLVQGARRTFKMATRGAGGEETQTLIRGRSFLLGGHAIRRPLVALSTSREGLTGSSSQLAGNVGGWILEQFVVTLDYTHHKLYLQRGRRFGEAMRLDPVGWQLLKRDHDLVVAVVPAGTPAARAGIQEGDVVLKMDRRDVSGLAPWEMRRLTDRAAGERLHFQLRRGERAVTAVVKLRNLL